MWNKNLKEKAENYAAHRELVLEDQLGDGFDGSAWVVRSKQYGSRWAIKCHRDPLQYTREKSCYERFLSLNMTDIQGQSIPQMIKADDEWLVIEMTIVKPPFLLDFASAYLDDPRDFSDEIIEQWYADLEEKYGDHFPDVLLVIRDMALIGVYLTDIHPGNLRF